MNKINGLYLLLGSATEKSVDGEGEIKRGAYKTKSGETGAYLVNGIVYNDKGEQIGLWNGEPLA